MLWHIMHLYAAHGLNEFVLALGYKAEMVRSYFLRYHAVARDLTVHLADGTSTAHGGGARGLDDRPDRHRARNADRRPPEETAANGSATTPFCLTYGDGVSDVDIGEARRIPQGARQAGDGDGRSSARAVRRSRTRRRRSRATSPRRSRRAKGGSTAGSSCSSRRCWITSKATSTLWEKEPLERLAKEGQLRAFRHEGFWQPMDTLRDLRNLESLWAGGSPPWKTWK